MKKQAISNLMLYRAMQKSKQLDRKYINMASRLGAPMPEIIKNMRLAIKKNKQHKRLLEQLIKRVK